MSVNRRDQEKSCFGTVRVGGSHVGRGIIKFTLVMLVLTQQENMVFTTPIPKSSAHLCILSHTNCELCAHFTSKPACTVVQW